MSCLKYNKIEMNTDIQKMVGEINNNILWRLSSKWYLRDNMYRYRNKCFMNTY